MLFKIDTLRSENSSFQEFSIKEMVSLCNDFFASLALEQENHDSVYGRCKEYIINAVCSLRATSITQQESLKLLQHVEELKTQLCQQIVKEDL